MKIYPKYIPIIFAVVMVNLSFSTIAFSQGPTIHISQDDFIEGTLIIDQPGNYQLTEDISFNPHPPGTLDDFGNVLEAYNGGRPFPSQLGNPYDPAAFGLGFFAAIVITAENVTLDLNGMTIEQSEEHALLQRFFAVIELTNRPFISGQGPFDFGSQIKSASNVMIKNGIIGRSSHHGIHGNGNTNVTIENVDFDGFEVAAVALNGVNGLTIEGSTASNRVDVPVNGRYSNALFILAYVDFLVANNSPTTLTVNGSDLSATEIQSALRDAINAVHADVIITGSDKINRVNHPAEYALFHNKHGVVDGNAYGFLVNPLGVAVDGFPFQPPEPSTNIQFHTVDILSLKAFVSEVVALQQGGKAVIDPIGAVFPTMIRHPDTGALLTVDAHNNTDQIIYKGNVLANAQAIVAKAALAGEFANSFLDTSRLNITEDVIKWIEGDEGLAVSLFDEESDYLCNGDTMFHVNKGVIGFKMDGAENITAENTSVQNVINWGEVGSALCGNYTKSHPKATLTGYGGTAVRGYSAAGSKNVLIKDSFAADIESVAGPVIVFDVLTDSHAVQIDNSSADRITAGESFQANGGPNPVPDAIGVQVSADATDVVLKNLSFSNFQTSNGGSVDAASTGAGSTSNNSRSGSAGGCFISTSTVGAIAPLVSIAETVMRIVLLGTGFFFVAGASGRR
ncbi:MAG: right-handed parallel beta-helix repeat-containing protein [Desulfosarcinaceae bacterium]|nr:right-handed parallel beta-helix repeat-containing protein [Desulfosarcinaceae bacterium]